MNVVHLVVERSVCVGCGICAGLCPAGALAMEFNVCGEFVPVEKEGCITRCTICLRCCPASGDNANEDMLAKDLFALVPGVNFNQILGYYTANYVGSVADQKERLMSASGGLGFWLLWQFLQSGMADSIICAGRGNDQENLFQYTIFTDLSSDKLVRGSVYYPMECSAVIRAVLEKPGKYLIVCLPCVAKAIRLAQKARPVLKDRIIAVVGLVCGQQKSKVYTKFLASLAGENDRPKKVGYRGKDATQPANNFFFSLRDQSGAERRIYWREGASLAWTNHWFTMSGCSYCDDVFAETADVVLMDAWLPDYDTDHRGTSIILPRSSFIDTLLREGCRRNELTLAPIPIADIIASQDGAIKKKTSDLSYRLYKKHRKEGWCPNKRISPSKMVSLFRRKEIDLLDKMQELSRLFASIGNNTFFAEEVQKEMQPLLQRLHVYRRFSRLESLAYRVLRKLFRIILGRST